MARPTPAQIFWQLWTLYWVATLSAFLLSVFVPMVSASQIWDTEFPSLIFEWDQNATAAVGAFLTFAAAFRAYLKKEPPFEDRSRTLLDLVTADLLPAHEKLDEIMAADNPYDTTKEIKTTKVGSYIKELASALNAVRHLEDALEIVERRRAALENPASFAQAVRSALSSDPEFPLAKAASRIFELVKVYEDACAATGQDPKIVSPNSLRAALSVIKPDTKLAPSVPSWIPGWATKEWFLANPTMPSPDVSACRHPEQLQSIVQLPTNDPKQNPPWNTLLDAVQQWIGIAEQKQTSPAPTNAPIRLPKIPTFDGTIDLFNQWSHRVSDALAPYLTLTTPPFVIAHVLSALDKDANVWATGLSAADYYRASAKLSLLALLEDLRKTFSDPEETANARAAIRRLRSTGKTYGAFLVEFESLCRRAHIALTPTPENTTAGTANSEIANLWISKLPTETRDKLRIVESLESLSYAELRAKAARLWHVAPLTTPSRSNLPARAADPITASSRENTAVTMPARNLELPPNCANHTDRMGCPPHLRGPLGEAYSAKRIALTAALIEESRCFICRGKGNFTRRGTDVTPAGPPSSAGSRPPSSAPSSSGFVPPRSRITESRDSDRLTTPPATPTPTPTQPTRRDFGFRPRPPGDRQ